MKTHGILMSAWSINRYLAGAKTQTRRANGLKEINKNPDEWEFKGSSTDGLLNLFRHKTNTGLQFNIRLPYGWKGDTLYFKETAKLRSIIRSRNGYVDGFDLHYRADDAIVRLPWQG